MRTQSQLELKRMESEQKFVLESGDDEAKLYSSETEESSARDAEDLASKKTSVDRERKVGVGVGVAQQQPEQPPPQQSSAYQQLLLGGQKQPPVPAAEEDTSEDDIEAQLALPAAVARPRPGLRPGAGASSLHNMDEDESFGHPAPGTHHQPASQVRYISTSSAKYLFIIYLQEQKPAEPLRLSGLGGHPMPLSFGLPGLAASGAAPGGLAGGRLGHPLAQRVGLMAVASGDTGQHVEDTGHVSAPDNDDDDDFWS